MLTVLYRTPNEWLVFADGVEMMDLDAEISRCKRATASAWIWGGPSAVAKWMVKNPTRHSEDLPAKILLEAKADLSKIISELGKALHMAVDLQNSLKVPKTKKKKPRAKT